MKSIGEAYLEMDERDTTERILREMTDPETIEQKAVEKRERERVGMVKSRHSL